MRTDREHLDDLLEHIQHVRDHTERLGRKLINDGYEPMGRQLIANGLIHDYSKFDGIEWTYMRKGAALTPSLHEAVRRHATTNLHHPEAWTLPAAALRQHNITNPGRPVDLPPIHPGVERTPIHYMPDLYVAELVCDWLARSGEFGTSIRDWIANDAATRFGFTSEDLVYTKIMKYVDALCDRPFVRVDAKAVA